MEVVLREHFQSQNGDIRADFMIIGFGKLGGSELNYSSDVDLAYVVEDGLDEKANRQYTKFFEAFGRALSDRMGRGSLYRVDLRLRPYGGTGPILQSMRAYEAYYKLYAEPWEVQALLRSQPIVGSDALKARWEAMRTTHCFRPRLSELNLEQMLGMKERIEKGANEGDLKRGEGGIRDVEFLTQIMQMLHGFERPNLQVRATCDALRALESEGFLEHSVANVLVDGYTFLRKMEHRTQLVGDQQTHSIPTSGEAREGLAKLMGASSWSEVSGILEAHRRTIQTLYRSTLGLEPTTEEDRSQVHQKLGPLGPAALHWFDGLPESTAFYHGLVTDPESLERVTKILNEAPRLVPYFKSSVALTELLLSGEIEDTANEEIRIRRLPIDVPLQQLAAIYVHAYALILARWVLAPNFEPGEALSELADSLIEHCCKRLGVEFDVLVLGSLGTRELGGGSDADLLLLTPDKDLQQPAEREAQQLLALAAQLKRYGVPLELDLRLRPEGGKGLLVRTYDGLRAYDLDGMEMWERFALGHARLLHGHPEALQVVNHCAYGLPLTPERLAELTKMKRRIETERVKPQHVRRQVKLGSGGLSDIEWLIHLHEMRFPTATKPTESTDMPSRIRRVANARLINMLEAELLIEARQFLMNLRTRIFLMGLDEDLIPENPDRLDRLAHSCGFADGNSLLARHQSIVEAVRRMYMEGLERLKT